MRLGNRAAVSAGFSILGVGCAGVMSSIPDVKSALGLDDARLGTLLLAGPAGMALSYALVAVLLRRFGSRLSVCAASAGYLCSLLALAACFAWRPPIACWILALAVTPVFGNALNVSINTQAGLVERQAGRSIMSSFHAIWSGTNLAGGLLVLAASHFGIPPAARLAGIAGIGFALLLVSAGGLVPSDSAGEAGKRGGGWCRPDAAILALGLAAMLFMGCEGTVNDWVGVFYRDTLKAPAERVQWGYCAVMAMMTVGRCFTDRFVNRTSATFVVRLYSALVCAGLLFVAGWSRLPFAGLAQLGPVTLGYAVVGFGISGLSPLIYAGAARSRTMAPGAALTVVGSIGFLAFFAGPPLIGFISNRFGLAAAFALYALLMLFGLRIRL